MVIMVDMTKMINNELDNEISINGVIIGKVSDNDVQRLVSIVSAMACGIDIARTSTPSKPLVFEEASTPSKKVASKKVKKVTPPIDYTVKWVVNGKSLTYVNDDSEQSFVSPKDVRKVLNDKIKTAGGTWDFSKKTWVFSSVAKVKAFIKATPCLVTADERQTVRNGWNNK